MSYNAQCRTGCQKFLGDSCNSCSQELQKCATGRLVPLTPLKMDLNPYQWGLLSHYLGGVPLNCLKK